MCNVWKHTVSKTNVVKNRPLNSRFNPSAENSFCLQTNWSLLIFLGLKKAKNIVLCTSSILAIVFYCFGNWPMLIQKERNL